LKHFIFSKKEMNPIFTNNRQMHITTKILIMRNTAQNICSEYQTEDRISKYKVLFIIPRLWDGIVCTSRSVIC